MNTKRIAITAALAIGVLSTLPATGFSQVRSAPTGVVSVSIAAAPSASQPSLTALSIPLYPYSDFQGYVRSVDSATQVTLTGATWTANQFGPTASGNPTRIARVKASGSASSVGRYFAVISNTTNQLTVDLAGTGVSALSSALAPNDSIEVLPLRTIGSVFGSAAEPPVLAAGATAATADNVLLWNGTGWDTYFWTGSVGTPNYIWKRSGNTDRSTVPIYPEDGVFVVHRDTTPAAQINLMGNVPVTAEQSVVAGQTFLANRFPRDTTLAGLGLHGLPGWTAGATAATADKILILNADGGWDTYFWTGSAGTPNNIWKRSGNTDRSSIPIAAGTAVFITHAGADLTLLQPLPYTP